jgi:hypothetical protein
MSEATEVQQAACRSIGTKQCAAICLSNLPGYAPGGCPEARRVWSEQAIAAEKKRRPDGPLSAFPDVRGIVEDDRSRRLGDVEVETEEKP